jgi:cell division protein FtsB
MSTNMKWLISVASSLMVFFTLYAWVEARIEKRVEERMQVNSAIEALKAANADTKTWLDGRCNTLDARINTLERDIGLIRQASVAQPRTVEIQPAK